MPQFIRLPESGITVDADRVLIVFRQDINQYVLFMGPTSPVISGVDKDAFDAAVGAKMPELPNKIAT